MNSRRRQTRGAAPSGTQALSSSGGATSWAASRRLATLTLSENSTLANPTGLVAGDRVQLLVTQDATGYRTLSFGSTFDTPWPSLNQNPTATTLLEWVYDGTKLRNVGLGWGEVVLTNDVSESAGTLTQVLKFQPIDSKTYEFEVYIDHTCSDNTKAGQLNIECGTNNVGSAVYFDRGASAFAVSPFTGALVAAAGSVPTAGTSSSSSARTPHWGRGEIISGASAAAVEFKIKTSSAGTAVVAKAVTSFVRYRLRTLT